MALACGGSLAGGARSAANDAGICYTQKMRRMIYFGLPVFLLFSLTACAWLSRAGRLSETPPAPTASLPPQAIASPTPAEAAPSPEPSPTLSGAPELLLDLPYTKDAPLTDPQEIRAILAALRLKQEAGLARAGWRLKTSCNGGGGWMDCMYFLTHVTGPGLACAEQFVYYMDGEKILPAQIMLADGSRGAFDAADGTLRADSLFPPDPGVQCSLESLESVDVYGQALLPDESAYLDAFLDELSSAGDSPEEGSGAIQGGVRAWVETLDGKQALVLAYAIDAYRDPKPVAGDPATGLSEVVERSLRLKFFDLASGFQIQEQDQLYLQNGQVLGDDEWIGRLEMAYYESLPEALAQAFAAAAAQVEQALGR